MDIALCPAEIYGAVCIEKRRIGLEGVVEVEHLVAQSRLLLFRRRFQTVPATVYDSLFCSVIFRG